MGTLLLSPTAAQNVTVAQDTPDRAPPEGGVGLGTVVHELPSQPRANVFP